MNKIQFGVLYRQFLFRMVDLEVLSADGDVKQLLGQFAGLLIWFSSFAALGGLMADNRRPEALVVPAHFFIATTMLITGLFAVLSWDSSFPDRRDVLVLGPLPVSARTMFLSKVAALGLALSVAVMAFNGPLSLIWPIRFAPAGTGLVGVLLAFAAFWIAVFGGGAFVFCALLGVQGIAAQLPRRYFLRLSSILQISALALLICGYFLEPAATAPRALAAAQKSHALDWWPSYWFFGLFEKLNGWPVGAPSVAVAKLAARAMIGLAIAVFVAATAFLLSYLRTLRKIVEEPDILPGTRGGVWLPRFGDAFQTAVVRFAIRSLMRSRQHRVILAFYLGIGFAILTLYLRSGALKIPAQANVPLVAVSLLILVFAIAGTRVVIGMPLDLRANWVFRLTATWGPTDSLRASRRFLLVLAVLPVWTAAAALFFTRWPRLLAAGHMVVLVLMGLILVDLSLYGFRKIPFTCSYLPGKSQFHMAFLGGLGLLLLSSWFAEYELNALARPFSYAGFVALLALIAAGVRWRVARSVQDEPGGGVQFEDVMTPAVQTLGLNRDGVVPIAIENVGPALPLSGGSAGSGLHARA